MKGWVCLNRGVAAQSDDDMSVIVWPTEESAQAWCDGRPKQRVPWQPVPITWVNEKSEVES